MISKKQHVITCPFLYLLFLVVLCIRVSASSCPGSLVEKLLSVPAPAPADSVVGQVNFTTVDEHAPPASSLGSPVGVAVSPVTGKLFISNEFPSRILRFSPTTEFQMGGVAEAVLGQDNFTASVQKCDQTHFLGLSYILVDDQDTLWASDQVGNRILRFDNASSLPSGSPANAVLGQPDFTSCAPQTRRKGLNAPYGLWVEPGGFLWVADKGNSRVLRYDFVYSKPNGAPADGMFGQYDYSISNTQSPSQALTVPYDVAVDGSGNLFVADLRGRIMRYDGAKYKTNNAAADAAYGVPSFTAFSSIPTANATFQPVSVTVDGCNNLFVADLGFFRIVMFPDVLSGSGHTETLVLGQYNYTTVLQPPLFEFSASQFGSVIGQIHFDINQQRLYFADVENLRVLAWTTPPSPANNSTTNTTTSTSNPTTTTAATSNPTTTSSPSSIREAWGSTLIATFIALVLVCG